MHQGYSYIGFEEWPDHYIRWESNGGGYYARQEWEERNQCRGQAASTLWPRGRWVDGYITTKFITNGSNRNALHRRSKKRIIIVNNIHTNFHMSLFQPITHFMHTNFYYIASSNRPWLPWWLDVQKNVRWGSMTLLWADCSAPSTSLTISGSSRMEMASPRQAQTALGFSRRKKSNLRTNRSSKRGSPFSRLPWSCEEPLK